MLGMTTWDQLAPPSMLTPATSPRAPPFDQRSCCQVATMLLAFAGLTSTQGSTVLSGKSRPTWVAALSAVQPAKGSAPDTCTGADTVKLPAQAAVSAMVARTSSPLAVRSGRLRMEDLPAFGVDAIR